MGFRERHSVLARGRRRLLPADELRAGFELKARKQEDADHAAGKSLFETGRFSDAEQRLAVIAAAHDGGGEAEGRRRRRGLLEQLQNAGAVLLLVAADKAQQTAFQRGQAMHPRRALAEVDDAVRHIGYPVFRGAELGQQIELLAVVEFQGAWNEWHRKIGFGNLEQDDPQSRAEFRIRFLALYFDPKYNKLAFRCPEPGVDARRLHPPRADTRPCCARHRPMIVYPYGSRIGYTLIN